MWGNSLLLIFAFAPRRFCLGASVFPPCQKWTFPNSNSILMGEQRITSWMNHLWIVIYSFIYLFVCLLICFRLCQCAAKSAPRDLLAINSCSHRLLFRFCIVADDEPVATTSMPTSTGTKSIGTNLRAENQGPALGSPQTPPTSNTPSTR